MEFQRQEKILSGPLINTLILVCWSWRIFWDYQETITIKVKPLFCLNNWACSLGHNMLWLRDQYHFSGSVSSGSANGSCSLDLAKAVPCADSWTRYCVHFLELTGFEGMKGHGKQLGFGTEKPLVKVNSQFSWRLKHIENANTMGWLPRTLRSRAGLSLQQAVCAANSWMEKWILLGPGRSWFPDIWHWSLHCWTLVLPWLTPPTPWNKKVYNLDFEFIVAHTWETLNL